MVAYINQNGILGLDVVVSTPSDIVDIYIRGDWLTSHLNRVTRVDTSARRDGHASSGFAASVTSTTHAAILSP
jgi:hypothetical protein